MRFPPFLSFALAACATAPSSGGGGPDTVPTTSPVASSATLAVSCALAGENALRWDCAVTVDPPQPVVTTWQPVGGTPLRVDSPEEVGEHLVPLRFMRFETTYEVTVSTVDGTTSAQTTFTTASPPTNAALTYTVEGTSTVQRFLHATPCALSGTVFVSDATGAVVWYEQVTDGPGDILNVQRTQDDTVLVLSEEGDVQRVHELDWDGEVLFQVERYQDFDASLHHDASKHGDHVYALFKDRYDFHGQLYTLDGFYVFDAAGTLVAEWAIADHIVPEPPGGGAGGAPIDYTHTNAIEVDDEEVTLSLRHRSALVGVRRDWNAPDFGQISWVLSGNPNTDDLGSDWVLSASAGATATFVQQHHGRRIAPDRIAMFDNREEFAVDSRVIEIALDDEAGTADIDRVYDMGRHCNYQGGVYYTAAGNPVATCAPAASVYEFDAGVYDAPRYQMAANCPSGTDKETSRFTPLEDGAAALPAGYVAASRLP